MRYIEPDQRRPWLSQSLLILMCLVGIAVGMAFLAGYDDGMFDWRGLGGNLATELLGAIITYFIIERIVAANVDKTALKERLIRRLENPDNGITWGAVQELRANGWLQDGSLYGWFLKNANLSGADLRDANVNGFGLYRCDLTGAKMHESQFVLMNDLRSTIMPDSEVYDGRYCLFGDLNWALMQHGVDVNNASHEEMAAYYRVPLARYLAGQRWAKVNLAALDVMVPEYLNRLDFGDDSGA